MGSEMGNNNVSGIREEEKPAVEVAEKGQEAVPADEVKGENYVILGDKTQCFNAKGEELSSDGLSASNGSDAETQKSNEKEIGSKESKHESISQDASLESNNSNCEESDVQKTDSPDEDNNEKPLEIHDQPAIGRETETKQDERTDSSDSKNMSNQPSESSNYSTSSLEGSQSSLSSLSDACNSEERENAQKGFERDESLDDFVSEETHIVADESEESNTSKVKCDGNSAEEKFGSGLGDTSDAQLHLRKSLSEFCDSSTAIALQCNSLDPSVETPEPQEMCIIHDKDNDLISSKSEDVNKQESTEINSTGETFNELIINNSAPSMTLHDASSTENGEEVVVQMISTSSFEKVCPSGKVKVTHKRSKSAVAGNKMCVSIDQFEAIEEDIKMLLTFTSVSTQPSSTDKHNKREEAMGKTSMEETEKREGFPTSVSINNGDRGTSEECRSGSESLTWESSLLDTSSASRLSSQNDNATLLIPDAAEDGKKVANIDQQDLFVNGKSNLDAHKETMQTLDTSGSTVESLKPASNIQIQTTSGTSADTEVICNWSNQQCPSGQPPDLANGKAQENSAREGMVIMESNPGHPGNQVQRSKSPSFDFGFQLDAKSEDSDQTPLLHHDNKTAARSFSGFANVRFQNRIIQTDYGRKSLDFEPVGVEEKTIRMERSDSDISRASFMNLLKKDEKGSSAHLLPKKQESPAGSNHSEELSTEELALKGSGKQRKIKNSRASIFTSCICCTGTASIH